MKRLFTIILAIIFTISFCVVPILADDNNVDVYITVSDITDYNEPLNILIDRHKISVSDFNLADFGDTMTGIECIEGITYLHALVQLHRNIYGDAGVSENLLLTTDGVTKIFLGKSVANVMYKNGRDIFALPQLINIKDGDEIQVCLYDEGHSQAIATFNEARIDNISPHEEITLQLQQHYGFPRSRDAIFNAEIIDDTGEYITDDNGDIIVTNEDGKFNLSFPSEGSYTISAMPIINYYMSDTGGGIKVEYVPQTVIKEVEYTYTGEAGPPWVDIYDDYEGGNGYISSAEGKALYNAVFDDGSQDNLIVLFDWDNTNNLEDSCMAIISTEMPIVTKTETRLEEVTELVRVETIIPDSIEPMVTYTTPFVTINVTTDIIIEDIYKTGNNLVVDIKNSEYNSEHDMYIAGYNDGMLGECKVFKNIQKQHRAVFEQSYDLYKVFIWQDGTMIPIMEAEAYDPNEVITTSIDYDYTLPMPDNTYTTARNID